MSKICNYLGRYNTFQLKRTQRGLIQVERVYLAPIRVFMDRAGLIYDDSRHYIDHLAPFCALEKLPLIVCEPMIAELIERYYPNVKLLYMNQNSLTLPSTVISCETKLAIHARFPEHAHVEVLWLPHGNSDKGWQAPFFEALTNEDIALVYGQKMRDFIKKKGNSPRMIDIGNFRKKYWLEHKTFYDQVIASEIPFTPHLKTYLYAPTWDDRENNGTFWQILPMLAKTVPTNCMLLVKIHPNTYLKYTAKIEQIIGQYLQYSNICFVTDFPPIYPLLNCIDAYIGDMSSIGYDFLYFNREMFFITSLTPQQSVIRQHQNPEQYVCSHNHFLHSCGHLIAPERLDSIFSSQNDPFKNIRQTIYDYTFS